MEFEQTLQWSDRFLTGVVEIDDQHRILVGILNEAGFRLSRDGGADYLEQVTSDLLSYAIYHFATEERLMLQYDYGDAWPEDAQAHLNEHRDFSSKVMAVGDQVRQGQPVSTEELLRFLRNWLVNHVLNTDQRLGAFIKQQEA